jgi:8-oxo-dGTP diphosphatase
MKTVYLTKPKNFIPKVEVVGCICWQEDKFLCLLRNSASREGNKWGFPAGKINPGENLETAIRREMREELALVLNELVYLRRFYIRYPDVDYTMHLFEVRSGDFTNLVVDTSENQSLEWKTIDAFMLDNTVKGNTEMLRYLYSKY